MQWLVVASFAYAATREALVRQAFDEFKLEFKRSYASPKEEAQRYALFRQTFEKIKELNALNGEPVFGLTAVADRKPEEKYQRGRKGHGDLRFLDAPQYTQTQKTPPAVDWRETKAVTAVKNQGQCGSCWAFSTTEEVESQYILHVSAGYAENFSPQQVTSCVQEVFGCGGGDTVTAFDHLKKSPYGLANDEFWPYMQGLTPLNSCLEPSCTAPCSARNLTELSQYEFYIGPSAKVSGFQYATPPCMDTCAHQDLPRLAAAVAEAGPVSICLNAAEWDSYKGGVLTAEACGGSAAQDVDHCVQLVGFNATAATPYWIVRNSWSTSWGMEGYIHLEYGKNTCGVANEATIALLESDAKSKAASRAAYTAMYTQATRGLKPEPIATVV